MALAKGDERLQVEEAIRRATLQQDPALAQLMGELDKIRVLDDILGDNYYISGFNTRHPDKGKVQLKRSNIHGMGDSRDTWQSMGMAKALADSGQDSFVDHSVRSDNTENLKIIDELLSDASKNMVAYSGWREEAGPLTPIQRDGRLTALLLDSDRGYNRNTGAPFGESGIQGGHILPHKHFPLLSNDPSNLMLENRYQNMRQGDKYFAKPEGISRVLGNNMLKQIREDPTIVPGSYSPEALAEMAAGPEIRRITGGKAEINKAKASAKRGGYDIYRTV